MHLSLATNKVKEHSGIELFLQEVCQNCKSLDMHRRWRKAIKWIWIDDKSADNLFMFHLIISEKKWFIGPLLIDHGLKGLKGLPQFLLSC